jgi:ABC-type phosphate transport system substrate-binding protein
MNLCVIRYYFILLLLPPGFQFVFTPFVHANDVRIIVHPDVQESISVNDIRNIFLGKKTQWSNNQRIRFVLLTEKTTYRTFITNYVRKTLYQYRNYWRKKVFTGTGMMPIMFSSCSQSIDYVRRTKGAISFVPETCAVSDGVKEVTLD